MAFTSSAASLVFKIDGDSSQLRKELKSVDSSFDSLGSKVGSLGGAATVAAAGFAAIGAAAVATGKYLYDLAKSASDYGSEIFDATEKTGLAAETISSIKVAADQSGTSLEQVTSGLAKFAKNIGEADHGSEEAAKKLERLHVTSKDLDTALGQALTTIAKYPPGVRQMTAAQDAFGKSGAELLPFIKSFDGNLPALIAKCKELGLTMSDEDAAAADAFGDQMDTLNAQMAAVGRTIGIELMPVFMDMAQSMSKWLAENKDEVQRWGSLTADILRGLISYWNELFDASQKYLGIKASDWLQMATVGPALALLASKGAAERQKNEPVTVIGDPGDMVAAPRSRVSLAGPIGGDAAAEKARREAEKIAERNLKAKIQQAELLLRGFMADLETAVKAAGETIGEAIMSDDEIMQLRSGFGEYLSNIQRAQAALKNLQDQQKSNMTVEEKNLLAIQQRQEKEKNEIEIKKILASLDQTITESEKKNFDEIEKRLDMEIQRTGELLRLEEERRRRGDAIEGEAPFGSTSVFGSPEDFGIDMTAGITNTITVMQQALIDLKSIGVDALGSLAQGLGNMVQQWVLMGNTGPNAMKKLVAGILGGVAAQAAVLAIMETAYGVAALTPWGAATYGPAAAHFKAAALFGSVAAIAAAAGRGVAGNAFAQQTSGGGGSSGGGGGGQQGTSHFTEAFHGFGNRLDQIQHRTNVVLAGVEEQLNRLSGVSPGHLLVAGAKTSEGQTAIFDAHTSVLGGGGNATETMVRATGRFR